MSDWIDGAQRDRFSARLEENPYDQATRLVFADFLEECGEDDAAAWQREWTPEWQKAKEWLWKFAETAAEGWDVQSTFDVIVQAGHDYLDKGETVTIGDGLGFGACNRMCSFEEIGEFWKNWSTYTRRSIIDNAKADGELFTCCM